MLWKKKRVYLDYAAGAVGNPSSPHKEGRIFRKQLDDARREIAKLIEVQSDDIIFTSGATEANALAILGITKKSDHVLYLPSAHASIVENVKLLTEKGVAAEALPIRDSRVDIPTLTKMLQPNTKLVSMDAVCGETGVIWNTREVKNAIGNRYLHVDASQASLTEKLTRAHFNADMLTLDGMKVGVRGIGALIVHRTIPLRPLYRGGGQERGLRPGTEMPELVQKFAMALRAAVHSHETFRARAARARADLIIRISHIPGVIVNEGHVQAPNILNMSFPGRDTDYLVVLLDEAGFAVSTRSACETDSEEGSRAVLTLTGDAQRARATLRVSFGPDTSTRDLVRFAKALTQAVAFIDKSNRR